MKFTVVCIDGHIDPPAPKVNRESYLLQSVCGPVIVTEYQDFLLSGSTGTGARIGFEWYTIIGCTGETRPATLITETGIIRVEDPIFRCRLTATSSTQKDFPTIQVIQAPTLARRQRLWRFLFHRKTPRSVTCRKTELYDEILLPGHLIAAQIHRQRAASAARLSIASGQE